MNRSRLFVLLAGLVIAALSIFIIVFGYGSIGI